MKKRILIACVCLSTTLVGCSHPVKFKKLLPKKYANFLGKDDETNIGDESFISDKINNFKNYKIKISQEELKEMQVETDIKNDMLISEFIKDFEFNKKALNEVEKTQNVYYLKNKIDLNNYKKNIDKYNKILVNSCEFENKTGDEKLDNLLFYLDKYNKVFMNAYSRILSIYNYNTILLNDTTYSTVCQSIIKYQEKYVNKLKDYIEYGNIDFNLEKGIELSNELVNNLQKQYKDNEKKYYDFVGETFSKDYTLKPQYIEEYKKDIKDFKEASENNKYSSVKSLDPILKSVVERYNKANYNFKKSYIEIFDVDAMSSNNVKYNAKKLSDCEKYRGIQYSAIITLKMLLLYS